MACACKSELPRSVPARDVGLRSSHKSASYMQLAKQDNARRAAIARPQFAASRNALHLGVGGGVHAPAPGGRTGSPVKLGLSPVVLVALGGALWLLTRAK